MTRALLMTEEMANQFADPDRFSLAYDQGQLEADLERFVTGGIITFGTGRQKTCLLKVLDPWIDEIWEFRSRDPKPGARVFGRFAGHDCFIATGMLDRDQVDFKAEILRCQAVWRRLFASYPPHSGPSIHAYVSGPILEV